MGATISPAISAVPAISSPVSASGSFDEHGGDHQPGRQYIGNHWLPAAHRSIVGVIAGNSAKSDIRNRPGQVTGEGMAQAGCRRRLDRAGAVGAGYLPGRLDLWRLVRTRFCALLGSGGQTSMLPALPVFIGM